MGKMRGVPFADFSDGIMKVGSRWVRLGTIRVIFLDVLGAQKSFVCERLADVIS